MLFVDGESGTPPFFFVPAVFTAPFVTLKLSFALPVVLVGAFVAGAFFVFDAGAAFVFDVVFVVLVAFALVIAVGLLLCLYISSSIDLIGVIGCGVGRGVRAGVGGRTTCTSCDKTIDSASSSEIAIASSGSSH